MDKFDFSGWATRNDLLCGDGRIIRKNAFKHCDGIEVPVVYNHDHKTMEAVLGHALLENRDEGVYAYIKLNDTDPAKHAKEAIRHGDLKALSIYANQLKQMGNDIIHGTIRELSLVLAGANPGAFIDFIMAHGDGEEDGFIASWDENTFMLHSSLDGKDDKEGDPKMADNQNKEKTVADVFDTLTEEQKTVVYALVGAAMENSEVNDEESEGGKEHMKHNVFDADEMQQGGVLTHADQEYIMSLAKQSNVGSFKQALGIYAAENGLMHSDDNVGIFEDYGVLFPELELITKGEPETIDKYNQSWVGPTLAKIHKSPYSRIRTRFADARLAELKAKGYQNKGDQKTVMNQITMINRETTPQTIYIKDSLHRDDIIDVTDFSIVAYQWKQMRRILDETMVLAAMVGDGREVDDPDKIKEAHVRPIWTDNEEYTIHHDVDIEAARAELQGTNTSQNFSENYIYVEAIIRAALYSREKFKGTGTPDFYCTPHLVNVMLLARDLNGRRIYDSKVDLARALNVNSIVEVEQFEGLVRTTEAGDKKKLLGLFVNMNDYTFGSTKGGEITKFEDFDMDFNLKKFMLETRLSGSLYKLKSAIALEEPVADEEAAG